MKKINFSILRVRKLSSNSIYDKWQLKQNQWSNFHWRWFSHLAITRRFMPQLHRHVIAFEVIAETFYTGASVQNAVQGKQMGKVVWWGDPWPRTAITASAAVVSVSLLSAISLKGKQKKHVWKATASKWLPGGYIFDCLFSWCLLGKRRETLSHLRRPSEWDKNETRGDDSPHEWPHYSEGKTPEWEWYVHVQPR